MFTNEDTYAAFINLDHRFDRLAHMSGELRKSGLANRLDIKRIRGMLPSEYIGDEDKVKVMRRRTPGAIGCHYSQVKVMAYAEDYKKHAFIMEDDLIFCDDFLQRLDYIANFLSTHKWDVMWLGATLHINPPYWHTGRNPDLIYAYPVGRDAELTDDPRILRTYGAFSTYAYIVNRDSIDKVLQMLDSVVAQSMGIDWAFIKLQPQLLTYAFVPGSVKQMDNNSDIGKPDYRGRPAVTTFSNFRLLNKQPHDSVTTGIEKSKYWWQRRMEDFNPLTFNWAEAKL